MSIFGITFSASDLWLLGIAGCLAMALIGYRLTDTLNRRNSFRVAADNFRAAIDVNCTIALYNVFQVKEFSTVFAAHKEASRIFRGHLYCFGKRRFAKAWNQYEEWGDKILTESKHITTEGVYALTLAHEGRDVKTELSEHLKRLLKLAEKV